MDSEFATFNQLEPAVSILLPFHGNAPYLDQALESVLNQSFSNFECLLISNNAEEGALKVARRYCKIDSRFTIFFADSLNLPQALNLGIVKCRGQYIARMDSDDIMNAERIAYQLSKFYQDRELLICGSDISRFGRIKDSVEYPTSDLEIKIALLFRSCFANPTIMVKKFVDHVCSQTVIHYDEKFPVCEDFEMFVRYFSKGVYENIPKSLLQYRIHNQQLTFIQSKLIKKLSDQVRKRYILSIGGNLGIVMLHNAKVNGIPMFGTINLYLINQITDLLFDVFNKKHSRSQIMRLVRKNYGELVKPSFRNIFSCIRTT